MQHNSIAIVFTVILVYSKNSVVCIFFHWPTNLDLVKRGLSMYLVALHCNEKLQHVCVCLGLDQSVCRLLDKCQQAVQEGPKEGG